MSSEFQFDFSKLISGEVTRVPVEVEIDLTGITEDVKSGKGVLSGTAENHAGYLEINCNATYEVEVRCARCAEVLSANGSFPFVFPLCEELQSEDTEDYLLLSEGKIDLFPLVEEAFALAMPTRFLCNPDCKGICQRCGANLNKEACTCQGKEIDPRLADLLKFFDED